MKIDAATRTVDRAEARERGKAQKALEKWLKLRRAQLALGAANTGPSCADDDADTAFELIEQWAARVDEPEVEVTPAVTPDAPA